jgi:hypothetical protein
MKDMVDLLNERIEGLLVENERLRSALEDIEGSPVGEGGDSYEMKAIAEKALAEGK